MRACTGIGYNQENEIALCWELSVSYKHDGMCLAILIAIQIVTRACKPSGEICELRKATVAEQTGCLINAERNNS